MCDVSRSSSKLPLLTWTRVTISREGRVGTLRVNDDKPVVGRSQGSARELNLQTRLYVGGLPGKPHPSSGVTAGLVGAVQRVCNAWFPSVRKDRNQRNATCFPFGRNVAKKNSACSRGIPQTIRTVFYFCHKSASAGGVPAELLCVASR